MEIRTKIITIVLAGSVEAFTLKYWLFCKNFTDIFHNSSINLTLQMEDYIYNEKGTLLVMTRAFNNKLIDSFLNLLRFYFQFWDIRFGSNWFSLVGYFGILTGFYYISKTKKKTFIHWAILILMVLPLIEILINPHVSFIIKILYLWMPFSLFSLYGLSGFLSHGKIKKRAPILLTLSFISLWWIAYLPHDIARYCIR